MSIVMCKKTRRQFIVGTGNTLLALPLLPSLFPSAAMAQAAAANDPKLMLFMTDHNMLSESWVNPLQILTQFRTQGTKEMMLKDFSSLGQISPVLTDSVFDTLRMNNQMTILRGMSMQAGVGHGNLAGLGGSKNDICPTFDTIIEDSQSVYPSATTGASVTKAIRIDLGQDGWLSRRKVGSIFQSVPTYGQEIFYNNTTTGIKPNTVVGLYTDVFKSLTNGTVTAADTTNKFKTNILNRVFESYQSFKSNRRISSDDIARLDQHMGFLSDLQNSLKVILSPAMACSNQTQPINSFDPLIYNPIYMDLLAVAFKCGLTKLGVMYFESSQALWTPGLSLPDGTGLHGGIHGGDTLALQTLKRHSHMMYDKYMYNTIAKKFLNSMNVVEGATGRTYLDNMITAILPNFGMEDVGNGSGHRGNDTQAMLFGSMGGRVKAGRYFSLPVDDYGGNRGFETYIPHNALFVTLLDLMGVPKSEYEKYSNVSKGWGVYGSTVVTNGLAVQNPFTSRFYGNIPEMLV